MKLNFKMMAIAAALASLAGTSQAALTGVGDNNGSMALVAYAQSTKNWYIRDLGYLINSFLPTGVTTLGGDGTVVGSRSPSAGLTINSTGAGGATANANFADSSFSTWYNAQANNATDVVWMVGAYDQNSSSATQSQRRLVVTSTNAAETFTNTNVDSFTGGGAWGGLGSFFGSATLSQTGDVAGGGASALNSGTNGDFNAGVGFANVGSSQYLYYAVRSAYTGATSGASNVAVTTAFGNATGLATLALSSDGQLVYSLAGPAPEVSAVPVPAAAWLLGSGLLAMGAAARRRRAAAQA